ncbi:MAG: hypothetical protein LWW93_11210 [Hyphomicrobiales bacterium]|nr:hypothetical protein [Hyphomicrobiales bacterium]
MQVDGKGAVDKRIAGAFKAAADATGASFDYLLKTSQRESDHRTDLAASGSSAKGLFQFVDQTWFELVRREGPSVGLERFADKITTDGKGGWTVADPVDRAKILALRTDPLVSAVMAGKFTQDNARRLGDALGRTPSDGELYAAHVLGAAGATRLFRLASSEPNGAAAVSFPKAAAANPGLFYEAGGRARTNADLFAKLTRMPESDADPASARIASAHRNLSANASKTDAASVALLLRAQAAAVVGEEKPGSTGRPSASDLALAKAAFSQTPIPGSSDTVEAGRLDGWRAKLSRDAFTGLVRNEAGADGASAALDATRVLPGATGALAMKAVAAAGHAGAGAIERVDPDAPMSLAATAPPPSVQALERAVPERPSRYAGALAAGAPAAPLPMVDAARGEVRPSRLLFENWTGASDEALAAGVVRVRTSAVTPTAAAGATVSASLPTAAGPAAQTPLAVEVRRTAGRSRLRPLDLIALSRAGVARAGGGDE